MHAPDLYRIAFIEPAGPQTEHFCQLLAFEGIDVVLLGVDQVDQVAGLHADLVVLNHTRLRGSTLAIAASLGAGMQAPPLTLALMRPGDEMRGIELVERGVDAYIVASCGSREFVARVRALLRRARPLPRGAGAERAADVTTRPVRFSDLHIDPSRRRVSVSGHDLRLTEQEFQLLYFLAGNPGRVFDRQALLDAVWGSDTFVTARSVDALVKRLRQQLRAAGRAESRVETVRGVGYRLAESGLSSAMSAA
jgi:DNA-binding response OmpR family regulator